MQKITRNSGSHTCCMYFVRIKVYITNIVNSHQSTTALSTTISQYQCNIQVLMHIQLIHQTHQSTIFSRTNCGGLMSIHCKSSHMHIHVCVTEIIGASLSEPLSCESAACPPTLPVWIYIYIYIYICMFSIFRPTIWPTFSTSGAIV